MHHAFSLYAYNLFKLCSYKFFLLYLFFNELKSKQSVAMASDYREKCVRLVVLVGFQKGV